MPEDEPNEEWPPEADSETDETPSEADSERSPVGAMDRDAGELGPAGAGAPPADSPGVPEDDGSGLEDDSEPDPEDTPETDFEDSPATGSAEDHEDAPLSELREEVSERGEVASEEFEELFEEIDVASVDDGALWEELSETAEEPLFTADAEAVPEADVTVVEKSLCHRCPHFGDPPELHCTHEETTIDAEVDTEHFRVVNCPIVAQQADVDASDFSTNDR